MKIIKFQKIKCRKFQRKVSNRGRLNLSIIMKYVIKNQWISILEVGLSSGTAWAVRGQFGHEKGAALAGGIGALALVLVSKLRNRGI
jgi:hypothetical protein